MNSLIDPELWALVDESRAFYASRQSGRGTSSLEELHAFQAKAPAPAVCDPLPAAEVVSADGRDVPVRTHMPVSGPPTGVVLEIHTGGFFMGSAAGSDLRNRRLVDELGVAVVSVDYRLAPEHPWPAAPDDCETAALWLAEHSQARFGTTSVLISGFSAGSTLAMTTLLRMRDRGLTAFGGCVLQCGTYDLSARTPAGRLIADEYFLDAYAGAASDRTHPDLSPVFANLRHLPPVLIVIGADDVLLEDNLVMASRLAAVGNTVDLRIYPASPHAFTGHPTSMARAALSSINDWLLERSIAAD
ncbi:alpha/beta hydrolase [Arthrobacter sp. UYEF20]|uniref:alpha/beta hydrolase n=1 Tax=Arthrobacter sp. UYEF20 TaxID=1756363 RepID=UPI0033989DB2